MRLSAALIVASLIAAVCLAVYALAAAMIGRATRRHTPILRHLALYALGTCITIVLFATLGFALAVPSEGERMLPNLVPFDWLFNPVLSTRFGGAQYAMNIALFIPVGFLLPAVFASLRRWWKVASVVLVVVLLIESTQYLIGRVADIDDLIANVIGSIIGAAVFLGLNRYLRDASWWRELCGVPPTTDP